VDSHLERRSDRHSASPQASELVAACETAWSAIQRQHPEVPDAVIVLGSGVERGRLVKLGHWWAARWIAEGDVRGEVLLAGEALHLNPEDVFEVLLHEAAHGLNAARGIKDSSRGGRYHNARFKEAAEDLGLTVANKQPYGWAETGLGPVARDRYEAQIVRLGDAMRIARRVSADVRVGESTVGVGADPDQGRDTGARGDRQQPAICGCGRRIRMAPSVLARGPVVCGLCGREFSTSRVVDDRVTPQHETTDPNTQSGSADQGDEPVGLQPAHSELSTTQREGLAALV